VENLLDPAHVDISHDRTSGGGKRENARPYEMHIDPDSLNNPQGFTGRYRQDANKNYTEFAFEAPGILRQYTEISLPKGGLIRFGTALHCMPLTLGRSRLLFRVYSQGLPAIAQFILKHKPLWMRHLNSCLVLEQDVGLIATQEDHFARKQQQQQQPQSSGGLKDDYLLIKSSDAFVGAYRSWLDRVGAGMPVR
jgi:Pheophorbide a oxygenase